LLDEPTNHLDIQSIEVLVQALQQYEGSFVLVSHDRYFVSEVATKIWWIEDEQIREYPGTYKEFLYWKSQQEANNKPQEVEKVKAVKPSKNPVKSDVQKQNQQKLRKLEQKINGLETQVVDITTEIKNIEKDLANPEITGDRQKLLELSNLHQSQSDRKTELSEKMDGLIEQLMLLEEKMEG